MPGWSTILRVDKAQLGLDSSDPEDSEGEGTLHDGDRRPAPEPVVSTVASDADGPTPFDETTEPPAFDPPPRAPPPAAPSRIMPRPAALASAPLAPSPRTGGSARSPAPVESAIENLTGDEYTQLDEPAPEALRALARISVARPDSEGPTAGAKNDSTLLDTPLAEIPRPIAATSVQVEGVVGERLPPVIVRRAPAPTPAAVSDGRLLENAPVARTERPRKEAGPELTQINAAAALGIAPEPAAPPSPLAPAALGGEEDKTPPPAIGRVDFGPLKLSEKEEVLARYPVEAPGLGAAERLGEKAPTIAAMSKVLPVVFVSMVALSFVGVFLIGPLGDMLAAGERQTARDAIREAQARELAAQQQPGSQLPTGSIRVVTQPSRAAIEVDGYYLGRSPMMIAPPEERPHYKFRISAEGHKTWEGEVQVLRGGYVLQRLDSSDSTAPGAIAPDGAHHKLVITLDPQ